MNTDPGFITRPAGFVATCPSNSVFCGGTTIPRDTTGSSIRAWNNDPVADFELTGVINLSRTRVPSSDSNAPGLILGNVLFTSALMAMAEDLGNKLASCGRGSSGNSMLDCAIPWPGHNEQKVKSSRRNDNFDTIAPERTEIEFSGLNGHTAIRRTSNRMAMILLVI
jgi:hypothetical protein